MKYAREEQMSMKPPSGWTFPPLPPKLRGHMRKILLLTAGYGEGHNAAARGLQAAFQHLAPDSVEAQFHDLFATTYGAMHEQARRNYLLLINRAPRVWAGIYTLLDRTPLLALTLPFLGALQRALAELIAREQPIAILSVYPVYAHILARLYPPGKARPFAFHTVITDSITVNRVWFSAPSDTFLVPNEDTARVLVQAGVDSEKIRTLGFPVPPRFALEKVERPAPGSDRPPRVLYMVNARPDLAPAIVRRLLQIDPLHLTVTFGRDAALGQKLEAVARETGRPLELHGWTNEMPKLLRNHHLLIGKAGGATVQETIAACTPMLLTGVVPGQEEGNARLLFDNDCGRLATTPEALATAIEEAFAADAAQWRKWEANITRLSRPDAALQIARFVLGAAVDGGQKTDRKDF
jgi:processive 1,2-diacylglycerol beta-glucosyltransferase